VQQYIQVVRNANVVLHTTAPGKKVLFPMERDKLLAYLLDLAQFEYELGQAVDGALNANAEQFAEIRSKAAGALRELALSFSGTLSLLQKDESLQNWFDTIAGEVDQIAAGNTVPNVQKIFQLVSALDRIMRFNQISQIIFIKETVGRVGAGLKMLARLLAIDEKLVLLIGTLSDFGYGFSAIYSFLPLMQARIKRDPFSVLKLRATFLKLISMLDLQLVRILQPKSADAASVSEHYSSTIVDFVRIVLEIVSIPIFDVLAEIIQLKTAVLRDLPNRIE
jgi:WASH complex subunit strumpellin